MEKTRRKYFTGAAAKRQELTETAESCVKICRRQCIIGINVSYEDYTALLKLWKAHNSRKDVPPVVFSAFCRWILLKGIE